MGEIDDQISFVAIVHEINLLLGFGAVFHEVPEASVAACLVPVVAFIDDKVSFVPVIGDIHFHVGFSAVFACEYGLTFGAEKCAHA